MEQIKENLKHDYDKSVESFQDGDYASFFRNIRPAIEYLSQFLIFDIWNNEEEAIDLINGDSSINRDRSNNTYNYVEYPANHKPQGRALPELFTKVYYCKHPDVVTTRVDDTKKRLKRGLDSCSAELCRYYSIASEIGSHAGRTSMDVEVQARGCAAFMMGFIDYIKSQGVISPAGKKFVETLSTFSFVEQVDNSEFEEKINSLIKQAEEKDLALLTAQKLQTEAEEREQVAQQVKDELEKKNNQLEEEIRLLKEEMASISNQGTTSTINEEDETEDSILTENTLQNVQPTQIGSIKASLIGKNDWDVTEETMDDDQLDLIEYTNDKSMLVAGCAGSGKSVIAMHKAELLHEAEEDVILIAYTKSLNRFMKNGKSDSHFRFFYHYQWKKLNMPKADYIIVDEIQDFTKIEIQEFIQAAKKHYLFFGDTAQSIYRLYGKDTMSIEQISAMTGLNTLQLFNNYRLPRAVAKITQNYVGIHVPEYKEKVYQNKETELPHFIHYESDEAQLQAILNICKENSHRTIGILLPSNTSVLNVCANFKSNNFQCEFKYSTDAQESKFVDTLDFYTSLPKIMTYHSAKGLQFDMVIIPFYNGAHDEESRKTLYVAMTRTMHSLYILYSTPEILPPLDVPSHLYLKD